MTNTRQQPQKTDGNKLRFSTQVFIVGMVLSITFFLLFIDAFKTYTSSITFIANAKSEIAVRQQEQIISNILEFPRTLAFYDRLLKYNPDVRDIAAGQSQDQRKKAWNSMLSVERAGENSSMIRISITAGLESDADRLAEKTTREIFDVVAMYYNINSDVDLRIIDGPISHSNVTGWYWTLPASIIFGFIIALFLQRFLSKSRQVLIGKPSSPEIKNFFDFKKADKKQSAKGIESLEDLYLAEEAQFPDTTWEIKERSAKETTPEMREMKQITKKIEPDKYPNFSEVPKASAPGNLPIADDGSTGSPQVANQIPALEPTPEQLKERLNKLLRGEL